LEVPKARCPKHLHPLGVKGGTRFKIA